MTHPEEHIYRPMLFERLCPVLGHCIPGFESREFIFRIFDNTWPDLDYRERTRKICRVLHCFMPENFPAAALLLAKVASELRESKNGGPEYAFLAHYIRIFGAEFPFESNMALKEISRLAMEESPEQVEFIQQ